MAEDRVERRLAAILAADVVGYSRLMGEDEEGTPATLKSYRSVIDELIQTRDGRVFGGAGDSVIAEFASPVEAVRCATEVQIELDKRSADAPDERRMWFRIGVNLGDVMVEGDNLDEVAATQAMATHFDDAIAAIADPSGKRGNLVREPELEQ